MSQVENTERYPGEPSTHTGSTGTGRAMTWGSKQWEPLGLKRLHNK